jgi:hypothetical protein
VNEVDHVGGIVERLHLVSSTLIDSDASVGSSSESAKALRLK